MKTEYFVNEHSVVRKIWGKSDTILFIFAGAAAEFALNKAVDWLYFTGRLPSDPIGRLFSTVSYARAIVFSEKNAALKAIDHITAIHAQVEAKRGLAIPGWAYRDVLFMLIDYSIRAYELLERELDSLEKEEVFEVFNRVGIRMGLTGLPKTFEEWENMRQSHMQHDLQHSSYTVDLFNQYSKHLGALRYKILIEAQSLIAPQKVKELLVLGKKPLLKPFIPFYNLCKNIKADWLLKALLLPSKYKKEIRELDRSA